MSLGKSVVYLECSCYLSIGYLVTERYRELLSGVQIKNKEKLYTILGDIHNFLGELNLLFNISIDRKKLQVRHGHETIYELYLIE